MSVYRYINNSNSDIVIGKYTINSMDMLQTNERIPELDKVLSDTLQLYTNGVLEALIMASEPEEPPKHVVSKPQLRKGKFNV